MEETIKKQIEILQARQETESLTVDELIRLSTQIQNLLKMVTEEEKTN